MLATSENDGQMEPTPKKKDVFRPSLLDMETGRRDRWRDEERDTHSSMKKDRWRDAEKELGENRRTDRWNDNSSSKHFGESRRISSERWTDSGNTDTNYDQRRESKWNTRWGPDDKDTEGSHEKWGVSGKDVDTYAEKGLSHVTNHGKDDKDGEPYRPWRPSITQNRGKGAPNQTLTPNKPVSPFSYNRGRGENPPATFSMGRGRVGSGGSFTNTTSNQSQPLGSILDKFEGDHGEPYPVKYNRMKLLDVYRMTDLRMNQDVADVFVPVPSLTLDEPLEPLALCEPNLEERTARKGIDKGDIVSSGAPLVLSKDGRNSSDLTAPRRTKLGSRDDLPHSLDESTEESSDSIKSGNISYSGGSSYERQMLYHSSQSKMESTQIQAGTKFSDEAFREGGSSRKETPMDRESIAKGSVSVHPSTSWQASPLGDCAHQFLPDKGFLLPSKDLNNEWESNLTRTSYSRDDAKHPVGEDSSIRRQLSGILEKEQKARKPLQSSPEDLWLYYKDPAGVIQGPFTGLDIIGWFESGYFGLELPVRVASAPNDLPFSTLGDVMPHLRSKAKPPPGFTGPKPNESTDPTSNPSFSGFGKLHSGLSEMDKVRNETRPKLGSATEAENRFLESLISGNLSGVSLEKSTFSEGMQGYFGNNSSSLPSTGVDDGNSLLLLAKQMALERQQSLPSPYQHWSGRDAAPMVAKPEIGQDSSTAHLKHHTPQSQGSDLMSILQGLSDKSTSSINNGALGCPNFSAQRAPDPLQNKIDLHYDQNFPSQTSFGIQQQRLQPQNQPLINLLSQAVENPSGISAAEKLLSSGLPRDPQLLNAVQQQYLLQLHSQSTFPTQQMLLLDKIMLLKQQQQKHEEQQQILRQQQLLSQVLSDHHSNQHVSEQSYGQLPAAPVSTGIKPADSPRLQPTQEMLHVGLQPPLFNVQDRQATNIGNLPMQSTQDMGYDASSESSSFLLPHQLFGNIPRQRSWGVTPLEQVTDIHRTEMLSAPKYRSAGNPSLLQKPHATSEFNGTEKLGQTSEQALKADTVTVLESDYVPAETADVSVADNEMSGTENVNDVKITPESVYEEQEVERNAWKDDHCTQEEVEQVDIPEPRKASEKKSKKQKSSKSHSTSEQTKIVSKAPVQNSKKPDNGKPESDDLELETDLFEGDNKDKKTSSVPGYSQAVQSSIPASLSLDDVESVEVVKDKSLPVGSSSGPNAQTQNGPRAWKHAPGFKAKSLLEIQEEEQKRAQTEMVVPEVPSVNHPSLPTPWAGIVACSDVRAVRETQRDSGKNESNVVKSEPSQDSKSKKSQLHDILAEEALLKSSAGDAKVPDCPPLMTAPSESLDNENFIEAKETKKSRKKSAKAKGAGTKASAPTASVEIPVSSSPAEKAKSTRAIQPEKEVLPAIPSGPSLGDFVLWKGESTGSSPTPAWSTDSGKVPKPASLRDIQKEQEKRFSSQHPNQMPTPQKSQPAQAARSNAPSWGLSATSPSKTASPIQITLQASQSKVKADDDLFWGPIDQSKQETEQTDFFPLATQNSWGAKNTPGKGTSASLLSRQKSSGKTSGNFPASSPAQSSLKGKRDVVTKHSEATDFRDWCESECVRLIGTKDTSFLEFCLKESRSEAELLLKENLGSYDPDHEFIEKFLNYKELLPSDVLDIAFQSSWNDRKAIGSIARDVISDDTGIWGDTDSNNPTVGPSEGSTKGGGCKKKGKKGKKVSPTVLGFNVVSNRIMMGEIQTVKD